MINNWPYSDIHELNLDWILSKIKELDNKVNNDIDEYISAYIEEHLPDFTVSANYDDVNEKIIYSNGVGATTPGGDASKFAIDNVIVDIKDATARSSITTINNDLGTAQSDITNLQGDVLALQSAITAMPTTILNALHPVGSEYITTTNTAPTIGGTWVLVDKELSDAYRYLTSEEYTDGTDGTVSAIQMRRSAHEIMLRINMDNVTNIGDPQTELCKINLSALGVSQFGIGDQNSTILSDTGSVLLTIVSHNTGIIECGEAFVIGSTIAHTYTGPLSPFDLIVPIASSYMLDSACNRFIWRRTA